MKRLGIAIGMLPLLILLGAAGWYLGSPLFLNRTVDEELPFVLPTPTIMVEAERSDKGISPEYPNDDEIGAILPPRLAPTVESSAEEPPTAEASATEASATEASATEASAEEITPEPTVTATLTAEPIEAFTGTVTETIATETPTIVPVIVGQGIFVDGDTIYKGSGLATLYEAPDGSYLLRFDDFSATNGPDLHVLLSTNPMPTDHESLGDYLDLGALKGNIGSQNYTLPASLDVEQYKSIVIYCLPFEVIFATATLE